MKKPTLRRVINLVRKILETFKRNEQLLVEIDKIRKNIVTRYSDIPEHKRALRKLDKLEREVLKTRKNIEGDSEGISAIFEFTYYIFKTRKIKKYRGKDVLIWIENDESIHFEFKNGSIAITRDGEIIVL